MTVYTVQKMPYEDVLFYKLQTGRIWTFHSNMFLPYSQFYKGEEGGWSKTILKTREGATVPNIQINLPFHA